MSKELVLAAQRGDLTEVKRLLADPEIDINFVYTVPRGFREDRDTHFTALAIAVQENKPDVVLYLLEKGALTESVGRPYGFYNTFQTALSLTLPARTPP